MNPDEVVVHAVESNRRNVVFQFLGEGVSQASESAHPHTHGQVLTLNKTGGDMLRVRVSNLAGFLAACASCGAVALLALGAVAVHLDQHGIVDIFAEPIGDRSQVHLQAIGCELHAIPETAREVLHKVRGASGITFANQPGANQLGVGIDCYPGPHVADAEFVAPFSRHVLLLGPDELPNFIALNPLAAEVYQMGIQVLGAGRAKLYQRFGNRVLRCARHAYRGTDRAALYQGRYDSSSPGSV